MSISNEPVDVAEQLSAVTPAVGVPADAEINAAIAAVLRCWLLEDQA